MHVRACFPSITLTTLWNSLVIKLTCIHRMCMYAVSMFFMLHYNCNIRKLVHMYLQVIVI